MMDANRSSERVVNRRAGLQDKMLLRTEQVKLLYSQALISTITTVVGALILTSILWKVVSHLFLIVWLVLTLLAVSLTFRLALNFKRKLPQPDAADRWVMPYIVGLACSGAVLGSAGIFLFPTNSFVHQVLLTFLIGGMVAGATATCSVLIEAFLAYSLPVAVPVMARLMSHGSDLQMASGGMLFLFFLLMLFTAYSVYKTTERSLALRFENSDLIDHLTDAKTQAERVVEDLKREIAEREEAEKALQKSEHQFRELVETMNEGLGVLDETGLIGYVNDKLCEMLGYSRDELVRQPVSLILNGNDRKTFEEEVIGKRLRKRASSEMELVRKNGRNISTLVSASPVHSGEGDFRGIIAAITDISIIKRAEKKLRESEEKYRMIFERSPLGIIHFDQSGTVTAYNDNTAKMSGATKDAFIGVNLLDYVKDAEMRTAVSSCLSGKLGHYEGYYESVSSGKTTPMKADYGPVLSEDGTVLGGIGIIEDISERKQAEKSLQDQLHFLQTLIDTIPSPIFYKDTNGIYLGCNITFERRLGLKREEIIGKSVYDILPKDLADKYHAMDVELFNEPGEQHYESTIIYSDGRIHNVIINKGTFTNLDGTLAGLVGVDVDITERKHAEEALRRAHDELELRVQARTAELARANEELRNEIGERKRAEEALFASSEKLKLFAYSVIHDLKSPAVGIYGLAKLLSNRYGNALDERARNYCDQIMKASEHVAALVEAINVYMATKEAPLNIEDVDIKEILQRVRGEFSVHLSVRHIEWFEPETVGTIRADRLSMLRVLRNLVDNALKYGGEQLSQIRIGYTETEEFHMFSVSDNGVGLKTEDSEKIFGVFQRNKTSEDIEGSGLGLAIVKEIVERHCGKIWVEPGHEGGATFHVFISKRL